MKIIYPIKNSLANSSTIDYKREITLPSLFEVNSDIIKHNTCDGKEVYFRVVEHGTFAYLKGAEEPLKVEERISAIKNKAELEIVLQNCYLKISDSDNLTFYAQGRGGVNKEFNNKDEALNAAILDAKIPKNAALVAKYTNVANNSTIYIYSYSVDKKGDKSKVSYASRVYCAIKCSIKSQECSYIQVNKVKREGKLSEIPQQYNIRDGIYSSKRIDESECEVVILNLLNESKPDKYVVIDNLRPEGCAEFYYWPETSQFEPASNIVKLPNKTKSVPINDPIYINKNEENFELKEIDAPIKDSIYEYQDPIIKDNQRLDNIKARFMNMRNLYTNKEDKESLELQFLDRIITTIDAEIQVEVRVAESILIALESFPNNNDSQRDLLYKFLQNGYPKLLLLKFKQNLVHAPDEIDSFLAEMGKYIKSEYVSHDHLREYIKILINCGNNMLPVYKTEIESYIMILVDFLRNKPEFYQIALDEMLKNAGDIRYNIVGKIYEYYLDFFLNSYQDPTIEFWVDIASDDYNMFQIISSFLLDLLQNSQYHDTLKKFWSRIQLDKSQYLNALIDQFSSILKSKYKTILIKCFLEICFGNPILIQILNEDTFLSKVGEQIRPSIFEFLNLDVEKCDQKVKEQLNKNICNPFLIKYCIYFQRLEIDSHYDTAIPLLLSLIVHTTFEERASFNDKCFEDAFKATTDALQFLFANLSNNCYAGAARLLLKTLLAKIKDKFNNIEALCKIKLDILKLYLDSIMYIKLDDVAPKNDLDPIGRVNLIEEEVELSLLNASSVDEMKDYPVNITIDKIDKLKQNASKLQNRLFHFLCRERYSPADFREWFLEGNSHLDLSKTNSILDKLDDMRETIEKDIEILKSKGYEYIHHNQIAALTAIDLYIDQHNLFLKLETGQGKSFIAERAAIQLLERDMGLKRVFVFTTYEHLAKRDQKNMEFLCKAHKIKTLHVGKEEDIEKIDLDQQTIIHVDADKFEQSLGHFLQSTLTNNSDKFERFRAIYDPTECAAILDEGDLMLLDNSGTWWTKNFKELFESTQINMKSQPENLFKNLFKNLIEPQPYTFINAINRTFFSAFDGWYEDERKEVINTDENEARMDPASGKITHIAPNFVTDLFNGKFQADSGEMNMVAYISKFKHIILLSGSIENRHIKLFEGAFDNKKENLFVKLPVFYGSHNRSMNLRCIVEKGNLNDNNTWKSEIEKDIEAAINREQPVLVFLDEDKITYFRKELESKFSKENIQVVDDEKEVDAGCEKAGKPKQITLATIIMGRGVDIKVSKHIKLGLHVLIALLPSGDKKKPSPNDRLLHQMKGRTARLDNKGTFSIIVQDDYEDFKAKSERHQPIKKTKQRHFDLYEVTKHFVDNFANFPVHLRKNIAKRWIMFFLLLRKKITIQEDNLQKIKDFISQEVIK